ncbi:Serine/threonine-protein phosphatase BSL2 [Camellia lanceoleosa]|uniref:Serine/threonine-protein phosphatase BSL2 n=1 Tax=Camellia lanceoleosa TaxID=1840588 RepID=A0ACC0FMP6_9ERIC|nr:Serine/threonine-protein phosphatase BSL2 [Camellia lanceoleosa]
MAVEIGKQLARKHFIHHVFGITPFGEPPTPRASQVATAVAGLSAEDLHVLDLTQQRPRWHRVVVQGPGPGPRYGHVMALDGGAVEYKLFVGSLNKQATEKEVEEIFSPYGRVEDVYLMRDEMKQPWGGPAFGGPGFGPRFQPPGLRTSVIATPETNNKSWFWESIASRSGDLAMPSTLQTKNFGNLRWASDNELTGSIPEFIGNWSKLKSLFLGNNKLTGILPAQKSTPLLNMIKDGNAERIGGSLTTG